LVILDSFNQREVVITDLIEKVFVWLKKKEFKKIRKNVLLKI